jgi:hypothetical protein
MTEVKITALQMLILWGDDMLSEQQPLNFLSFADVIDKAEELLAMEKEQIMESYCQGCADITKDNSIFPREKSEQYYKETYED